MKEGNKALQAVAEGTITNKIVMYPQLPELALTRVGDLAGTVGFSPEVEATLRAERWAKSAEEELFEAYLEL